MIYHSELDHLGYGPNYKHFSDNLQMPENNQNSLQLILAVAYNCLYFIDEELLPNSAFWLFKKFIETQSSDFFIAPFFYFGILNFLVLNYNHNISAFYFLQVFPYTPSHISSTLRILISLIITVCIYAIHIHSCLVCMILLPCMSRGVTIQHRTTNWSTLP